VALLKYLCSRRHRGSSSGALLGAASISASASSAFNKLTKSRHTDVRTGDGALAMSALDAALAPTEHSSRGAPLDSDGQRTHYLSSRASSQGHDNKSALWPDSGTTTTAATSITSVDWRGLPLSSPWSVPYAPGTNESSSVSTGAIPISTSEDIGLMGGTESSTRLDDVPVNPHYALAHPPFSGIDSILASEEGMEVKGAPATNASAVLCMQGALQDELHEEQLQVFFVLGHSGQVTTYHGAPPVPTVPDIQRGPRSCIGRSADTARSLHCVLILTARQASRWRAHRIGQASGGV
jgi:hypothetical protein